ncbi:MULTISPECIES: hypothetical protein [unclassified Bradyrhizobium]|uniref:hypothetical protein n=1 Tax=unclassified Bradyrhizobium TaxID=2631580 RepID=UPI0028ECC6AC|nr:MULTISPECIES: hypothetical protein [unclassified Bradyrhizobium]
MDYKVLVGIAVVIGVIIVEWIRAKAYQYGRLAGASQAVHDLSRACSYHYEEKDQPLPKNVDEALDYLADTLKRGTAPPARSIST